MGVPQFRPQAALHLFARTMKAAIAKKGQPPQLAPLLEKGMLVDTTQEEFYGTGAKAGLLGLWLEDAQKMAYGVVEPTPKVNWTPNVLATMPRPQESAFGTYNLLCFVPVVAFAALYYVGRIPSSLRR